MANIGTFPPLQAGSLKVGSRQEPAITLRCVSRPTFFAHPASLASRTSRELFPVQRLKAREKAAGSEKPTR
jgi:hypothetical protein